MVGLERAVVRLPAFSLHPSLSWAVLFDVLVGLPLLFYGLIMRRYRLSPWLLGPVLGACLALAQWLLPAPHWPRLPGLRPFVSEEHYRSELAAHPPALVVLKSPAFEVAYPALQKAVLEDYLSRRGYRTVRVGVVWFALRPDRYEDARRNGSLK